MGYTDGTGWIVPVCGSVWISLALRSAQRKETHRPLQSADAARRLQSTNKNRNQSKLQVPALPVQAARGASCRPHT